MTSLLGTALNAGLAFGRTVVLRCRYELEVRRLAPATINLRLAAVRRLAYEASDNGLLTPDLLASIRRVKGAKKQRSSAPGSETGLNALKAPDSLRHPIRRTRKAKGRTNGVMMM